MSLALIASLALAITSGVALRLLDATAAPGTAVLLLHAASSYALLALSVLHVAFHWRTLAARTRRWLLVQGPTRARVVASPARPVRDEAEHRRAA